MVRLAMYMFVPGACVPVKLPAQSDWLQHNEPLPERAGVFSVYIYLVPEIVLPQKGEEQKMHRVDGVKSNLYRLAPDESPLPVIEIDKKIALRHMYTEFYVQDMDEIAKECVKFDPTSDISRAIIAQGSYWYLIGKSGALEHLFEGIKYLHTSGVEVSLPSRLALLKYYSEAPQEMDVPEQLCNQP